MRKIILWGVVLVSLGVVSGFVGRLVWPKDGSGGYGRQRSTGTLAD